MKILKKIPNIEMDGKDVYYVYKHNLKEIEEGYFEIRKDIIDYGFKNEMVDFHPDAIDIEGLEEILN